MATDLHIRVRDIVEAALERPRIDRDAFIELAADGDGAVLREVKSLLPHYLEVAGFDPERPGETRRRSPGTTRFAHAADGVEWKPPFSIAPYRVVEVLGRGGMGVVYRGVQRTRNPDVAIKVLRRCLLSREDRKRFSHEEELLRRLRHPGIVWYLHGGVASVIRPGPDGSVRHRRPYFVMEYVQGKPLASYANEHRLSTLKRLELLAQICGAVEYAHHGGVIHRDLKPDNILVDRTGQPRILDFGIARLQHFAGQTVEEEAKHFEGTLSYASPEQRAGDASALSPASDVYTLGLIAHELLTDRLPHRTRGRRFIDLRNVHLTGPSPASRDREFRYALGVILATALRRTHGKPYTSAGELGADLTEIQRVFGAPDCRNVIAKLLTALGRRPPTSSTVHTRLLCALLRKRIDLAIDVGVNWDVTVGQVPR